MQPLRTLGDFSASLFHCDYRRSAVRVALVVGTILLAINHGSAFLKGNMTRQRWVSAALTYLVPYIVNVHGQYNYRHKSRGSQTRY